MNDPVKIIRKEFRRSSEARYIHRLHGVLLVLLGFSTVKAGKVLGDPQRTIAHWAVQFKTHGLAGLKDAVKSGRHGSLTADQRKQLADMLAKSPKASGIIADAWTAKIVSSLLKKLYNIELSTRQCARLMAAIRNQTKP
jgi:transposase